MTRNVILSVTCLLLTACANNRPESTPYIILQPGIARITFERAWGLPEKTAMMSGEEIMQADFGHRPFKGQSGSFYKGKRLYETWVYEKRGVTLLFHNKRLVNWVTDKTIKELNDYPSNRELPPP